MQSLVRAVLAIYLAHLLADFVFQTHTLVRRKQEGRASAYLWHGFIHYVCAMLLLGFFMPGTFLSARAHSLILALTAAHLLIDFGKIRITRSRLVADGPGAYLADQAVHLGTVAVAGWFMVPAGQKELLASLIEQARAMPTRFLCIPVIYILVVFGGGYLIRFMTRSMAEGAKAQNSSAQLQNAGLYIGWIERFLVVTALFLQSPATIGLILTAKAIARYPEFKSERFAEYFLIGTLLSIAVAIAGGAVLLKLVFGQVRFAG
jgi:hypothetical protein